MQDTVTLLGFVAAIMAVGVVGGNTLVALWDRHQRQNWERRQELHLEDEVLRQETVYQRRRNEEFREFCRNPTGDPVFQDIAWFRVDPVYGGMEDLAEGCVVLWNGHGIFIGKRTGSLTKSASKKL